VPLHLIAVGKQIWYAAKAPHDVKDLFASFTEKEMMVMLCSTLVMGRRSRNFDVTHLTFINQLLERPIDGRNTQPSHLIGSP
jgi:hypothetical protein